MPLGALANHGFNSSRHLKKENLNSLFDLLSFES